MAVCVDSQTESKGDILGTQLGLLADSYSPFKLVVTSGKKKWCFKIELRCKN